MRWLLVSSLVCALALGASRTVQGQPEPRAIYVTDRGNHRIVRMNDMAGAGWTTFGSREGEARPAPVSAVNNFREPRGIAVDAAGRIYVTDRGLRRIVRVDDMTGAGWTVMPMNFVSINEPRPIEARGRSLVITFKIPEFRIPDGIALDTAGRIYFLDATYRARSPENLGIGFHITWIEKFWRYPPDPGSCEGLLGGLIRLPIPWGSCQMFRLGEREFSAPPGISVDAAGRVYVTDTGNRRIVRVNDMKPPCTGCMETFGYGGVVIGDNRLGAVGRFYEPVAISVDGAGRIYVVDAGYDWIVRIDDMTGRGWTTFGQRGSGTGEFQTPRGIAVDAAGRIYVADTGNHRIVRVNDMTGAGWTAFGSAGSGTNQFSLPTGIVVDAGGRGAAPPISLR